MREQLLMSFLLVVLVTFAARAQSTYSAIQGTVTDDQDGVLPGVTVTITSAATGLTRSAVTNERGGNFIFQNETIDPMPADHYEQYGLPDTALASDLYDARFKNGTSGFPSSPIWYESVIARPTFRGTELAGLTLHPIDLAQKAPRSQRGTPRLADVATGRKIIDRIAQQSGAFGTTIVYENGVGVWKPGAAKTSSAQ